MCSPTCLYKAQRENASRPQAAALGDLLTFPFKCLLFCIRLWSSSDTSANACLIGETLTPLLLVTESGSSRGLGTSHSSNGSRVPVFLGYCDARVWWSKVPAIGLCVTMVNSTSAAPCKC